jgi:hypothetical protein
MLKCVQSMKRPLNILAFYIRCSISMFLEWAKKPCSVSFAPEILIRSLSAGWKPETQAQGPRYIQSFVQNQICYKQSLLNYQDCNCPLIGCSMDYWTKSLLIQCNSEYPKSLIHLNTGTIQYIE